MYSPAACHAPTLGRHYFWSSPYMFSRTLRSCVGLSAGAASLVLCLGVLTAPTASAATTTTATPAPATTTLKAKAPSTTGVSGRPDFQGACAAPTTINEEQCQVFVQHRATRSKSGLSPADTTPTTTALVPSDLQSAYDLASEASADGAGTVVSIVDAYSDPNIVSDLATFRTEYDLPACASNGDGCVTTYSETGGSASSVPADPTGGWEVEESLDAEMVSSICPLCQIDLYEANSNSISDLGTAENTAAQNSKYVSNSWEGLDYPGESYDDDAYFNHPGVVTAFAAGDDGYGAEYPASSQLVTSVGGTDLTGSTGAWSQTAWNTFTASTGVAGATSSGCSSGEPKPTWQVDTSSTDCPNRTQNDVAAVADGGEGAGNTTTGISIYDSYGSSAECGGWCTVGGTSVATPIITSVYALANSATGGPAADTYPAQYPYMDSGAGLTSVSSGSDAITYDGTNYTCESSRAYLCNAAKSLSDGYNGPTGWGTPNGANLNSFTDTDTTSDVVSVVNPGTYDLETGIDYSLSDIQAYTTGSSQTFTYTATGLPSGMTIDSSTGAISGTPSKAATSAVAVTVTDSAGAKNTIDFDIVATGSLDTNLHATTGAVPLALDDKCIDDANNSSSNGNKVQIWGCTGSANQKWAYYPDTNPGGAGILVHNDKCLAVSGNGTANGTKVELYTCNGTYSQQWYLTGDQGQLLNWGSSTCLDDPSSSTTNGTQLDISTCTDGHNQAWTVPAGPIQSGISGMCASDQNGSNANGTDIWLWACGGQTSQDWTLTRTQTLDIEGKCLSVSSRGTTNGSLTELWTCAGTSDQYWFLTGTGEIENLASEKCLDASGTGNGARLELEDCTGTPGEIWAQS